MVPTLGGGTQDTDFNKGFTKGIFTTFLENFGANKLGLDSIFTSWDLKILIPCRKLHI